MSEKNKILIVDDEHDLRESLSHDLTSEGYDVTTASNADEAIAFVQSTKFDLAIIDIKLPGKDGYEVLKHIKSNFPDTKAIMLTAYANLHHAMESKTYGVDDFLSKPYDPQDLYVTIGRLLSK